MKGWAAVLLLLATACGDGEHATRVKMDFSRPEGLYDAPFPSDDLAAGVTIDLSRFPNPEAVDIVEKVRGLLDGATGFATSGGVFFHLTGAIDPSGLPDLDGSVADDAPVLLVDIDAGSPGFGQRTPVYVDFEELAGLYAAPDMLSLVPLQGTPLRSGTRYAAVVTNAVVDAAGAPLAALSAGERSGYPAGYADAFDALAQLGVDVDRIAGLAVFTTGDPTDELYRVRDDALARTLPVIDAPFTRTDLFDDFCVYQTTLPMPDYQAGTPPYKTTGGGWTFDADGNPVYQRDETARLVVTVPRSAMPTAGFPLVVFVRTGGGGDRPMVDRGVQEVHGGPSLEPGEGPARYFARAGFAGLEVDGPLGGLRNPTGGDEQFLIFNVQNLTALRDNVRESAVELSVIAHVAAGLQLDTSDCPPAGTSDPGPATASFDDQHFALMGHSMGATIAPQAVAAEPLYRALLLSGAGGSWIENLVYKHKPLDLPSVVGLLLHQGGDIRVDDPMLTLAQWALEPSDPQVFGGAIIRNPTGGAAPRHVLMEQGIVDNYILPRIANTTSLSIGLDQAGTPLDDPTSDERIADQSALAPLLPLVGRAAVSLPASGNVQPAGGDPVTAVVVQHLEDGVEDGHEVVFQTDGAKHQYQCFLASWLADGIPTVPVDASRDAMCP